MGVVLEALKSLLPLGRLKLNDAIGGGIADAIEDLKGAARGRPPSHAEYPDDPNGTYYVNDTWNVIGSPFSIAGGASSSVTNGVLSITQSGPSSDLQMCLITGVSQGMTVRAKVAKRSGTAALKLMAYDGATFTTLDSNEEVLPDNTFVILSGVCPPGTTLVQVTRFGSGYILVDWIYAGTGDFKSNLIGGIIAEGWPGTAVDTLPQWHETMGVAYDPTARSVAEQQTMLEAMETAVGGMTLAMLQAQLDKEFDGRIVVSESYVIGIVGQAMVGLARCGLGSLITYSLGFTVSGVVYSSVESARVAAIIQRYAPAHLQVNSLLTDLSATEIALAGLGRVGIARTGKES